jgi:RHS repeat-associated protein
LDYYRQNFAYDNADRVTRHWFRSRFDDGTKTDYDRDSRGFPTGKARTIADETVPLESYSYDDAGRFTSVCVLNGGESECSGDSGRIDYAYDSSGNRIHESRINIDNPGDITYDHDDAHQLATVDGATLTYDADGNLTSDGTTEYTYDEFNKLVEIDDGSSVTTVTYDALGNRIGMSGGASQSISWDINNPLPLAAQVDDATYWYDPSGNVIGTDLVKDGLITQDALGNPTGVYSRDGENHWLTDLLPFGELDNTTEESITTDDIDVAFSGGYNDPTSDSVHLRLRDYNPSQGRFTSVDPLDGDRFEPYISPYVYADNQPTVLTDPSGAKAGWQGGSAVHDETIQQLKARVCTGNFIDVFGVWDWKWSDECQTEYPTKEGTRRRAQELRRAALALPVNDRADVAAELLASLDESAPTDLQAVETAWAREIEHRARRVISGESAGEIWDDVRSRLAPNL